MQSKIPSVPFEPLIFLSGLQLFAVKSLFVFNSVCMSIIFVGIHTFCIYIQIHKLYLLKGKNVDTLIWKV